MNFIKKKRLIDLAASIMLWCTAGFVILLLVSIIGYIVYNGIQYTNIFEAEVIDYKESSFATGDENRQPITFIIDKGLHIKNIAVYNLASIYSGAVRNWGEFSKQDIQPVVFMIAEHIEKNSLSAVLFHDETETLKEVFPVKDYDQMVRMVSKTRGSIGYIPSELVKESKNLLNKVKILNVQRLCIAVNPAVLNTGINGSKLRFLNQDNLLSLLTAKSGNWNKVGGIDLPVEIYIPQSLLSNYKEIIKLPPGGALSRIIHIVPDDEAFAKVKQMPGAVLLCTYNQAKQNRLPVIKIEQQTRSSNLTMDFLLTPPKEAGKVGGISSIILNTFYMILLTLLFSTPLGICAAVYFTEYSKETRLIRILRIGTETLAGIPSIIFGLFGFLFFVKTLKMGIGLLSGSLTLAIMILPTIIRTAEEAIKTVPRIIREGSLALGATKAQTIIKVVLPSAAPGIVTGIILGIGRAVGETAALLFTMGFNYNAAKNLNSSARVLSVHLYQLAREGISFDRAFSTATILIIIILIINMTAASLIKRMSKFRGKE